MSGFRPATIKSILRRKVQQYIQSLPEGPLRKAVASDILITGGSIASLLLGEKVNDYDIYFKTKETTAAVAQHYITAFNADRKQPEGNVKFTPEVRTEEIENFNGDLETRVVIFNKSAGIAGASEGDYQYFEHTGNGDESISSIVGDSVAETVELAVEEVKNPDGKYRPIFLTNNAITLTDKVQIIVRFFGTPEEIHRNFDFAHCTGVYDFSSNTLHVSEQAMMSLLTKQLIYSGSLYPVASVLRTRKFIRRGWNISAGQMIKIMAQLERMDWSDPKMLQEQLMGVDVAYMHELISAIRNRDKGQRIDATYLATLIDQVFDDKIDS